MDKQEFENKLLSSIKEVLNKSEDTTDYMLTEMYNNTKDNLTSLKNNCEALEQRLLAEMEIISSQSIVEGEEYDMFLKGYVIGCLTALKDMQYLMEKYKNNL